MKIIITGDYVADFASIQDDDPNTAKVFVECYLLNQFLQAGEAADKFLTTAKDYCEGYDIIITNLLDTLRIVNEKSAEFVYRRNDLEDKIKQIF